MFLLPIALLLAACNNVPEPDEVTPSLDATSAAVASTSFKQTPLQASPTPLPIAEYEGITLTFDEVLLGTLQEAKHKAAQALATESAQPEHVLFSFSGSDLLREGEIRVYPLSHYKKLSPISAAHIANLNDILDSRPVQLTSPLPLYPWPDTVNEFETAPVYIDFLDGRGLSFIALVKHASQEEPVYVFQGISDDGEYLITALAPLTIETVVANDTTSADSRLAQIANRSSETIQELAAVQHELDASFYSLRIDQESLFPAQTLDSYLSYPGVLMAFDSQLSGDAVTEKKPSVYTSPDGESIFLPGVPDAIYATFDGRKTHGQAPELIIQPIRGATGQFYPSVPAQQIAQVESLEDSAVGLHNEETSKPTGALDWSQRVSFQTGTGVRTVQEQTANSREQGFSYEYRGVTTDGRYFVSLSHPLGFLNDDKTQVANVDLTVLETLQEKVEQLDLMIQSLVINADASTDSSMPVNDPSCTNEAEFLEDVSIPDHTIIERGHAATKTWRIRNIGTCTWTPAYQILLAGGNPIAWQKPSVVDIVNPGAVTEISVEIVSPEVPGIYQAWWHLADESGESFGPFYHVIFESPRPATDVPGHGVVEGKIGYPASKIPAMIIYFARTDGSERYALETETGWNHYANELPAGDYHVFARVAGDESNSGGGFTAAVRCDMVCDDHELLVVTVEESKATRNVDVLDWYAPAGAFPLP